MSYAARAVSSGPLAMPTCSLGALFRLPDWFQSLSERRIRFINFNLRRALAKKLDAPYEVFSGHQSFAITQYGKIKTPCFNSHARSLRWSIDVENGFITEELTGMDYIVFGTTRLSLLHFHSSL